MQHSRLMRNVRLGLFGIEMSGFRDEPPHSHLATDAHHGLEVGEIRFPLLGIGMNQVGVDTQTVD